MKIHWLGAGLSSSFGIESIIQSGKFDFTLWNRNLIRAHELVEKLNCKNINIEKFDLTDLCKKLKENDLVISYLPAPLHYEIATRCLEKKSHLMTSSYITPEMQQLSPIAHERGLYFLNELGLDPGLDHIFAYSLVKDLNQRVIDFRDVQKIKFYSGCGGFPKNPGPFCYAFSWSPLGVLRALKNSAKWLENSRIRSKQHPWQAVQTVAFDNNKIFESYPNRDSLPYIKKYGLHHFNVFMDFQRATLRPLGWRTAWDSIFTQIESNENLETLSHELFSKYSYMEEEKDRAILFVELKAYNQFNDLLFNKSVTIDKIGSDKHSAMSQLVSGTTWCAIRMFHDGIIQKELQPGVYDFPYSKKLIPIWDQYLNQYLLKTHNK